MQTNRTPLEGGQPTRRGGCQPDPKSRSKRPVFARQLGIPQDRCHWPQDNAARKQAKLDRLDEMVIEVAESRDALRVLFQDMEDEKGKQEDASFMEGYVSQAYACVAHYETICAEADHMAIAEATSKKCGWRSHITRTKNKLDGWRAWIDDRNSLPQAGADPGQPPRRGTDPLPPAHQPDPAAALRANAEAKELEAEAAKAAADVAIAQADVALVAATAKRVVADANAAAAAARAAAVSGRPMSAPPDPDPWQRGRRRLRSCSTYTCGRTSACGNSSADFRRRTRSYTSHCPANGPSSRNRPCPGKSRIFRRW